MTDYKILPFSQVNTLVFNILSHIGIFISFQLGYAYYVYLYRKYLDTLNTFPHALPFKQSKNNIQRI